MFNNFVFKHVVAGLRHVPIYSLFILTTKNQRQKDCDSSFTDQQLLFFRGTFSVACVLNLNTSV
jgi:hypothetical protein